MTSSSSVSSKDGGDGGGKSLEIIEGIAGGLVGALLIIMLVFVRLKRQKKRVSERGSHPAHANDSIHPLFIAETSTDSSMLGKWASTTGGPGHLKHDTEFCHIIALPGTSEQPTGTAHLRSNAMHGPLSAFGDNKREGKLKEKGEAQSSRREQKGTGAHAISSAGMVATDEDGLPLPIGYLDVDVDSQMEQGQGLMTVPRLHSTEDANDLVRQREALGTNTDNMNSSHLYGLSNTENGETSEGHVYDNGVNSGGNDSDKGTRHDLGRGRNPAHKSSSSEPLDMYDHLERGPQVDDRNDAESNIYAQTTSVGDASLTYEPLMDGNQLSAGTSIPAFIVGDASRSSEKDKQTGVVVGEGATEMEEVEIEGGDGDSSLYAHASSIGGVSMTYDHLRPLLPPRSKKSGDSSAERGGSLPTYEPIPGANEEENLYEATYETGGSEGGAYAYLDAPESKLDGRAEQDVRPERSDFYTAPAMQRRGKDSVRRPYDRLSHDERTNIPAVTNASGSSDSANDNNLEKNIPMIYNYYSTPIKQRKPKSIRPKAVVTSSSPYCVSTALSPPTSPPILAAFVDGQTSPNDDYL